MGGCSIIDSPSRSPPRSYFESLSTSGPTHPHISTGLALGLILHGRMFHLRQHERGAQ